MFKKIIIFLFVFFITAPAFAGATVEFSWDNPTNSERITGFRIYQSSIPGVYKITCAQGLNQAILDIPYGTVFATALIAEGTWYWMMTSYDKYNSEGAFSGEITLTVDTIPPDPPINFKARVIQIPKAMEYLEKELTMGED